MPKGLNEPPNLDLPFGWEVSTDFDGKIYYIDHNTKKTTWIDPRDKFTKPETFADCIGNELPIGWEEGYDQQIGIYFINHNDQSTQLEDPRQEWKSMQEDMLREYLHSAQDTLEAKREIYDIKQQRLILAQDEYNHLNALAASRTSLCSSSSSCSTKFDPDLLRADLALAKERVFRLKKELARIHSEMTYTQRGVETLYSVEKKLNSHQNGCYNLSEAQAIMEEVRKIQKSLISGEREKKELMKSLAQVKDDLTRLQLRQESPDTSTFNLAQDRICAASQTDLCSENFPIGAREMAKLRLNYDEWRKRVKEIQEKLAALEERIQPGEVESDQDRLLLFQEKKQLLLEYRSIAPKSRSKQENQRIQQICKKLESDLNNAYEESNQCIATRLKVHEEKQMLLQQLLDALREVTHLEKQLKSVSASTLSISSGSSLGSLSTASSKGSLSGLSFTDIYGDPLSVDSHVDMVDVNRRVQRLLHPASEVSLSPRSSLSCSETPPASPLKLEAINEPMYENMQNLEISSTTAALQALHQQHQQQQQPLEYHQSSSAASILDFVRYELQELQEMKMKQQSLGLAPPLSPIYEKPSLLDIPQAALSRSSSASNTRSVSDESVAGDSGVFEASRALLQNRDTAQVQIGLKYSKDDSTLIVIVERARNLSALCCLPENCQLYIKVNLLPGSAQQQTTIRTNLVSDFIKPIFGNSFAVTMPLNSIYSKSLQISVVSVIGQKEEWVGISQISLAEFNTDEPSSKWYNIISTINLEAPTTSSSNTSNVAAAGAIGNFKEESSDESTIISSQTSTLTRNQGQDELAVLAMNMEHMNIVASDEEEDDDDDEMDEEEQHDHEAGICGGSGLIDLDDLDDDIEHHHETTEQMIAAYMNEMKAEMADKETNTECAFLPERARNRLRNPAIETSTKDAAVTDDRLVKRSQTFSPSAVGNKNRYICRLNRSDSDSAMHFHTITPHPFRRNAVERRSLRYHNRLPRTASKMHPCVPRTSLDLELDLKAQQTKLENLHDEIIRLRDLKLRLEVARDSKDTKIATWALENDEFKKLVDTANTDTPEDKKMQKLLHRTSKEIYKLRKTKVVKGQPDMVSFKEKIAFFTRKGLSVPEIPTDNTSTENLEKYLPLTPLSMNGDIFSSFTTTPSYTTTPSPSYPGPPATPKMVRAKQEIGTQSDDLPAPVDRNLGVQV